METKISEKRLKELERMEAKLSALEAGGVDNWEGYDIALEPFRKEDEIDDVIADFIYAVHDLMVDEIDVDYPGGRECGPSVTLTYDGERSLEKFLRDSFKKVEEIKKS